MKKKYEKPFIMKLDISGTNQIVESNPYVYEDECSIPGEIGDEQDEMWSRIKGSVPPCNSVFLGYTHIL